MATVWIEDLFGQQCPTCAAGLVAQAGRFEPLGKAEPTYVQDGNSLQCPDGHELPLDVHGNRSGVGGRDRGPEDPPREVAPPR